MYKLLSFDVYGTLINTLPVNVKAFRLAARLCSTAKLPCPMNGGVTLIRHWGDDLSRLYL
jgi:hypothetical protein